MSNTVVVDIFVVVVFIMLVSRLLWKIIDFVNENDIVISDEKQKITGEEKQKATKESYLENLVSEAENIWPSVWKKFGFKVHNGDFFKEPIKLVFQVTYHEIFIHKNGVEVLVYRSVSNGRQSFHNGEPLMYEELWYENLVDVLEKIISENDIQRKESAKEEESKKIEMLESEDLFDGWD